MLILILMMIGTVSIEFALRGPFRALSNSADLTAPFLQSRAWLNGINPYQQGLEKQLIPEVEGTQSFNSGIYPPSTSVVLSPLSFLSWSNFKVLWAIMSTCLFFLMLLVCINLASFSYDDIKLYVFIFFAIALAPFHTGIGIGQVSVPVIELCVISYWFYSKDMNILSGIILGLAVCLKPQIALFFCVYYLLRKNKKIIIVALSIILIVFLISEIPYFHDNHTLGASWTWWIDRVVGGYGSTGGDRFQSLDIRRFSAVNLHILFLSLFNSNNMVDKVVILVFLVFFLLYLYYNFVLYQKKYDLTFFSLIGILMLFPVYHRFYDASILIIPILWSIIEYDSIRKKQSQIIIFCSMFFLIPGATILIELTNKKIIQNSYIHYHFWETIVMPHQVWCLVIMYITLLYSLTKKN